MYIHVRIKTKQKEESIEKISETKYKVSVREEAKQNMANKKMIELVQRYFDKADVKIVSGHHAPTKILSIK